MDMELLQFEAAGIKKLLPWIETEEEILCFLRRVPHHQHYLRTQLALKYFFQLRDQKEDNFEQNIADDAFEIVILLSGISYKVIRTRLEELGNVANRKEIVVRQLLNEKADLKEIVDTMISNGTPEPQPVEPLNGITVMEEKEDEEDFTNIKFPKKRLGEENSDLDNENTNLKFKILKRENVYEVVSSYVPNFPDPPNVPDAPNVPNISDQPRNDDIPCSSNGWTVISDDTMRPTRATCSKSYREQSEETTDDTNEVPEPFNLINHIYNLGNFDEHEIRVACDSMRLPYNIKPPQQQLQQVMDTIYNHRLENSMHNLPENEVNVTFDEVVNFLRESEPRVANKPPAKVYENPFPIRDEEQYLNPLPISRLFKDPIIKPARFAMPNLVEVPAAPPEFLNALSTRDQITIEDGEDQDSMEIVIPDDYSPLELKKYDETLILRLKEIFPQACPDYIRNLCKNKTFNEFDNLVTVLLSVDYPKRPERVPSPPKELDLQEQLEIVKALLPDADPTYLSYKCETIGNDTEKLNAFINEARESNNYPTMKEYLRKQKFSAQSKQYTTDFSVENFVKLFPNPEETFRDPKRNVSIDHYSSLYISHFFQSRYDRLPVKIIRSILNVTKYNILASDDKLKSLGTTMKTRRKNISLPDPPQNIIVLQEIAYLIHKDEIDAYIKNEKEKEEAEAKFAKENGLMNECKCCFDSEVMPKNSCTCPNGCVFCESCIQKSCEIAFGEGKTEYMCLNGCPVEFTLQTLQTILPPKLFSRLAQKKALAEVKAAGIDELETCPFCDFASIPSVEDKIFRCLNPECMKESCRTCKEENHVPYKCDEVEKDDDVKARVFVENQMTEALLRKCWKCGTSFFKEEGCNKMTCVCGAKMCYICKQPVTDYNHFNGLGGDKHHLCPLYSDSHQLNQNSVLQAAEVAKSKVDPKKLKIDPTLDVKEHYETRKKQLPREPHLQALQDIDGGVRMHFIPPPRIQVAAAHHHHYRQRNHHRHRNVLHFMLRDGRERDHHPN